MDSLPNELLEKILLHLPTIDLLLSQRVCHLWQSLISDSSILQQVLFIQPSAGPFRGYISLFTASCRERSHNKRGTFSTSPPITYTDLPSGLVLLPGSTIPTKPPPENHRSRLSRTYMVQATLNPLLSPLWQSDLYAPDDETYDETMRKLLENDDEGYGFHSQPCSANLFGIKNEEHPWNRLRDRLRKSGPDASWRKMSVVQPFLRRVVKDRNGLRVEGTEGEIVMVQNVVDTILGGGRRRRFELVDMDTPLRALVYFYDGLNRKVGFGEEIPEGL